MKYMMIFLVILSALFSCASSEEESVLQEAEKNEVSNFLPNYEPSGRKNKHSLSYTPQKPEQDEPPKNRLKRGAKPPFLKVVEGEITITVSHESDPDSGHNGTYYFLME